MIAIAAQAPVPGAFCKGMDGSKMRKSLTPSAFGFSWDRLVAIMLGNSQLKHQKPACTGLGE